MPRRNKKSEHYVNNADFSQAVVTYVRTVNEAKQASKTLPVVPDYIAQCFLSIAEGLSHKSNFIRYTYREEMVMDAVENCLKAIENYDIEAATRTGKPNAFAYFTQITWYAFLRRIAKEKKQQDIKERYIDFAGVDAFADFDGDCDSEFIVDQVRQKTQRIRERDNAIKEFGKQEKKKQRAKRKVIDSFEQFYIV